MKEQDWGNKREVSLNSASSLDWGCHVELHHAQAYKMKQGSKPEGS